MQYVFYPIALFTIAVFFVLIDREIIAKISKKVITIGEYLSFVVHSILFSLLAFSCLFLLPMGILFDSFKVPSALQINYYSIVLLATFFLFFSFRTQKQFGLSVFQSLGFFGIHVIGFFLIVFMWDKFVNFLF